MKALVVCVYVCVRRRQQRKLVLHLLAHLNMIVSFVLI